MPKSEPQAKPFLKWVGGKWQLLEQMRPFFPRSFNTYFEPFLGGGAVFFYLKPKKAVLNDINKTLIEAYRVLKDDPKELIYELEIFQKHFYKLNVEGQQKMYLEIRKSFNEHPTHDVRRVSYLIFLNKTCFNGVYRENQSGEFNVPFGKNTRPRILDKENLESVSRALKNTEITSGNFANILSKAKKGDFVYLDPPYYPISKTSSFTNYAEGGFAEKEQIKLKEVFEKLDRKGCLVLLSNSHTPFIRDLYNGYRFEEINANRALNCKAEGRGKIKEYLIMNY